jgi:iron complex outermembrane receptor protein
MQTALSATQPVFPPIDTSAHRSRLERGSRLWSGPAVSLVLAAACGLLLSGTALAQLTAAADAAGTGHTDQLEEILVTAEKRSEDINKAPIAITALNMGQLQDAGVVSVEDLSSVAPSVEISTVGYANAVFVTIRGISNENFNGGNPEVAPYIDGIYVGGTSGLGNAFFDIDRVEVLRGPQGTLYGRNSTGGNLNIVTADPKHFFAASEDVSYGNYNDVQVHGMVNVPLSSDLAVRGAIFVHRNDGYYDTLGSTSQNYAKADDYGGRLTALWTPGELFTWRLSVDDTRAGGTPNPEIASGPTGQPLDGLPVFQRPIPNYPEGLNEVKDFMIRSRMNWQFNDALGLTYMAGYQNIHWLTQYDETNGVYGGHRDNRATSYSQEVDLSYQAGKLNNLLGANYNYIDSQSSSDYVLTGYHLFNEGNYGTPGEGTTKAWGVFDQATYNLTDKLDVIAGIRYSSERDVANANTAYLCPLLPTIPLTTTSYYVPGCTITYNPVEAATFADTTWKAGFNYKFTNDTSSYATVTTGFKAGGFNAGIPSQPTYAPEKITNYELGAKTLLLENRASINADVYYMKYRDIQVYQFIGVNALTTNAAGAAIYGAELEGHWRVTHNDRFDGFFTWTHAAYTQYFGAVDQLTKQVYPDISGNRLPHSPQFSARLQYAHDFELNNGGTLTPSLASYWQSQNYLRPLNLPIDRVGAYSKSDVALAYQDPSRQWTIRAYVHNIEDKVVRNSALVALGYYFADYNPPRTFGLRVAFDFEGERK